MEKPAIEYIWKDRKRYLGMPLSFTRYSLSEDRIFLSEGFINIRDEEILLYRVRDIETKRTLGQRMLGVGTVTVSSADKTMPILVMKNIKDPVGVKELLHKQVEKQKILRKVRLGEVMSAYGRDNSDALDEDDDIDGNLDGNIDGELNDDPDSDTLI